MSDRLHDHERKKLLELFEELIRSVILWLKNHTSREAVAAKGKCDMAANATKFTFTEFDKNGKIVPITKPITFESDNVAAATVDGTQQVINADGSVSVPVVSLVDGPGGVANIFGTDPANLDPNGLPLEASDVDNVSPVVVVLPPVSATGVLSSDAPATASARRRVAATSAPVGQPHS